ncbi:hypothetical protein [Bacillus sp. T33-2]|uniref:hypothetical protein n=1 Tax=Bacillus sp. T33-2 TaxID=2054168 RepID=UPI000C75D801|nr:hypothetical protein [Bacillus sp. T33-2]PLR94127.1 hypothetical protein CVD19_17750 [Bacillus sp. T33-2]
MRNSIALGTTAVLIVLLFVGWKLYSVYIPKPPQVRLDSGTEVVDMKIGTFSWNEWGRAATADAFADPTGLVRSQQPVRVTASRLKLMFEENPDSINCYLWQMETGQIAYKGIKENPLQLKDLDVQPGDYALEVRAKWEQGYVLYNARILVQ